MANYTHIGEYAECSAVYWAYERAFMHMQRHIGERVTTLTTADWRKHCKAFEVFLVDELQNRHMAAVDG